MFDGNIKGNMELNSLKLSEIRQDISTRRLAKWVTDNNQKNLQNVEGYVLENNKQPQRKVVSQKIKQVILATAQLLVK